MHVRPGQPVRVGVSGNAWSRFDGRIDEVEISAPRVAKDGSGTIRAETGSGSIDSSHPVAVSDVSTREKRLRGSVRGGGPRLSLHTSSGSIRIR